MASEASSERASAELKPSAFEGRLALSTHSKIRKNRKELTASSKGFIVRNLKRIIILFLT